jgi:hypothetical protein
MKDEQILQEILFRLTRIEASLAQIGPVDRTPTAKQEIAAVRAQGLDLAKYLVEKSKELGGNKKRGKK